MIIKMTNVNKFKKENFGDTDIILHESEPRVASVANDTIIKNKEEIVLEGTL